MATSQAVSISAAISSMPGTMPAVNRSATLIAPPETQDALLLEQSERFPGWAVLFRLLAGSLPGLMLIVIIFAGVRSGVFTATESACVAVLYALLVTTLELGHRQLEDLYAAVAERRVAADHVVERAAAHAPPG